jgi:hypothetical protein
MPENAASAPSAVMRSTSTRRLLWSATQPHRVGPTMRMTWTSDISTPTSAALMPWAAKYSGA